MDSRGYASAVSFSQTTRSGNFDRRLYGGLCAAIRRSSRTSASREWAHSMASTRSAAPSISGVRGSFFGGGEEGFARGAGTVALAARGRGDRPLELDGVAHREDPEAAQPAEQRVQHVDGRAGVVERAVAGRPGAEVD